MHISEGILSAPVLFGGVALTITGLTISIRKLKPEDIPKVAMLCALFFLASLVRVPIGPGSVHLVLCGLMGAVLGWGAFISIFVALLLQALLFQFGGLTSLGVNTFNMAAPVILLSIIMGKLLCSQNKFIYLTSAFCLGSLSILLAASLAAFSLWLSGDHFLTIAQTLLIAHLPLAGVEGLITVSCIYFLRKVKPDILPLCSK